MSAPRRALGAGLALLVLLGPACVTEARMLEIPARGRSLGELERRLRSRHDRVRAGAARELGRRRAPGAQGSLIRLLGDPAPRVRLAAVEGLAVLSSRPAREAVERALLDADPVVRLAAGQSVSQQPLATALPPLIRMLGSRELALKQLAVNRLYAFGPPVLPSLWPLLRDGNEAARRVAAQVLRNLRGRRFQEAIQDLAQRFDRQAADRPAVVALLRSIGPLAVERLIRQLLAAAPAEDIALAARLLGAVGDSALPALKAAYRELLQESEDPTDAPAEAARVRRERQQGACELALVALGTAGVIALVELAAVSDAILGRLAPCLERTPADRWTPALLRAVAHPKAEVRATAATALGRLRARTATAPLERLLRDPDGRVRLAAALAIEGLTGKPVALEPGPPLGIPECDRYLRFERCARASVPKRGAASREAGLRALVAQLVDRARQGGVPALVTHCGTMLAQRRQELATIPAARGCLR